MTKTLIKRFIRKFGFEIYKSNFNTSRFALMNHLLNYYKIDLVFDVGANCGQYAKLLRECGYLGKIISFEPLSSIYSQLLILSRKDSLWEIAPRTAIGDRDGEIIINIANNSVSSSVLEILDSHSKAAPESVYINSENVKLSRLDQVGKEYIHKNKSETIFLKIDVQGFEKQVVQGATDILPLIKGIQLELSLVPLYKDQVLFEEMLHILKNKGYNLHSIIPGFTDPETGRMLQIDGIFFKQ